MSASAIKIRPLRAADVGAVQRLFVHALQADFQYFPPSYIKDIERQNSRWHLALSLLDRRRLILVAIRGRQVVGFAFSSAHRDGVGHLYWLYVSPDLRKQKLGQRLLKAALDGMQARGMASVELVTYNFDSYYEQQGFWQRGMIKEHSADLHVMQYDLPKSKLIPSKPMPSRPKSRSKVAHQRPKHVRWPFWLILVALTGAVAILKVYYPSRLTLPAVSYQPPAMLGPAKPGAGSVVQVVSSEHYSALEVTALARQNYGLQFPASSRGATRVLIRYRTTDQTGALIVDYAQVYIPDNVTGAPILAMAPGTTGETADCSVSLEQPAVHNWANYQSHMMAYASRGFTGVITDYDNMRGATPPQPYMVGQAEGRAVLDSIRALKHLPAADHVSNFDRVFAAGYSQGGHAAFWADSINKSYASDIKLAGVIGWGPVLNVDTSWQGITAGSTLEWFGPSILESYAAYYQHDYNVSNILLPQWSSQLSHDVLGHCIDTDLSFWGTNPAKVYTPQFLADLKSGVLPADRYGDLQQDLAANQVVDNSAAPKLINQGARDNVVLPAQQTAAAGWLCGGGAPVDLAIYPTATHYDLMVQSFDNTLDWISKVTQHRSVTSTCQS